MHKYDQCCTFSGDSLVQGRYETAMQGGPKGWLEFTETLIRPMWEVPLYKHRHVAPLRQMQLHEVLSCIVWCSMACTASVAVLHHQVVLPQEQGAAVAGLCGWGKERVIGSTFVLHWGEGNGE